MNPSIALTPDEVRLLMASGAMRTNKPWSPGKKTLNMRRYRKDQREHYRELNRRHQSAWRQRQRP